MMVDRSLSNPIATGSSSSAEGNLNLERGKGRKRSMDEPSSSLKFKLPRYNWYFKLQSESSEHSAEDDTESVYSVQGHETEFVQDTPDTDTKSEGGDSTDSEVVFNVEYELDDDLLDDENPFVEENSSGTDDCVMAAAGAAIAAVICDNSLEWLTDGEESDNSSISVFDAERNHTGFGTCVQCKGINNNPMFRYCQKCFQERKNLFPPRPKGRRRKKRRSNKVSEAQTATESSCHQKNSPDRGCSSSQDLAETINVAATDSLMGSSKEKTREDSDIANPTFSQDSGIGLSQDFLDNVKEESVRTRRKRSLSTSEHEDDENFSSSKRPKSENPIGSDVITPSDVLKSEVSTKCNSIETSQIEITQISRNNDMTEVSGNQLFLKPVATNESNEKLNTRKGISKNSLPEHKELCIICNNHVKNSIFLHASIGHMCCCYKCAIHTWATNKRCPICNGKVKNIVKVFEC